VLGPITNNGVRVIAPAHDASVREARTNALETDVDLRRRARMRDRTIARAISKLRRAIR
jgi:hypothetical protein